MTRTPVTSVSSHVLCLQPGAPLVLEVPPLPQHQTRRYQPLWLKKYQIPVDMDVEPKRQPLDLAVARLSSSTKVFKNPEGKKAENEDMRQSTERWWERLPELPSQHCTKFRNHMNSERECRTITDNKCSDGLCVDVLYVGD
ncbi:hypothetical protein T265_00221 [Opisthorchis viverrini]|uniref:Uncharacterized protein n=1 Tax=Opisthorchis viverrini TaxID=6198 RepID=A0A075AJV3_OPIVI|nr:hypothetical protein T265_00221 [Opisthorchis viverrini]KER34034.1 hypothetical protein T265_00221 [Opisthorchis viverrini]